MLNSLRKGLNILRNEGILSAYQEIVDHLTWRYGQIKLYYFWKRASLKGKLSLSIGDIRVQASADDKSCVYRTLKRFWAEDDHIMDVIEELEEDDVFYDIGANTGLYSLFASHELNTGRVVSFEPYGPNIRELKKNADLNGLDITVINKALSNTEGEISLSVPSDESPGFGRAAIDGNSGNEIQIESTTVDRLVSRDVIPEPDVVKIDVEGAEYLVLQGLDQILRNSDCRAIYCEIHLASDLRPSSERFNLKPRDFEDMIKEYGFDTQITSIRNNEVLLKASRSI